MKPGPALSRASVLALVVLTLVAASCPRKSEAPPPADKPAQVALLLSADVRGYLEPCGCSEFMLGGLDRAAAQVEQARRELGAAAHLNGGDSLFSAAASDEAHAQQDLLKARAVAQAFASMDTLAEAIYPRDLATGPAALATLAAPYPLLGAPGSPGFIVAERGGIRLGAAMGSDLASLRSQVAAARAAGAEFVVALAGVPMKDLVGMGPELASAGADAALVGHQDSDLSGDEERQVDARLPLFSVKNRGRSLVRLDQHRVEGAPPGFVPAASDESRAHELRQRDDEIDSLETRAHDATGPLKEAMDKKVGEKQAQRDALAAQPVAPPPGRSWFSYHFVELSSEKPSAPGVRRLIDGFSVEVGKLNVEWAHQHGKDCPTAKPGQPAFIGTAECINCHLAPGDVWEKTGHHQAYATLAAKHKEFDLDCIRCHVVGPDQPGGVCRVDKIAGRENVGCESCHGAGSLHADAPEKVAMPVPKPAEQNCRVCHTPENSANFDYLNYLPKILKPGHGKPAK